MKKIDVSKPSPFDGRDLAICQSVFDMLFADVGAARDPEEAHRIAAIVVDLYRQGIRDPEQLAIMIEAARGIFPSPVQETA